VGHGRFAQARETVATNLLGAMATVDAAVAHFRSRGGGHVVGISSVAAFRGLPRSGSYSASKAGLAIYLEALRAEVYGTGIHVTVLYPGYIDTPLNAMLPRRPFVIPVERGAALIADGIERRVARATVPAFPWSLLAPLLRRLPTRLAARL
jgi:NAD(P)-dependent dehydrogenase (short-subunit alcohol dehydrogenase family)